MLIKKALGFHAHTPGDYTLNSFFSEILRKKTRRVAGISYDLFVFKLAIFKIEDCKMWASTKMRGYLILVS